MHDNEIGSIVAQIRNTIGADMCGSKDPTEARTGLSFWFDNYSRGNGPIFSIRPSGLKRHTVSIKFGPYATPCVEHIQSRATPDDYALANAFTEQLSHSYDLILGDSQSESAWKISTDFRIDVIRRVSDPQCSSEISKSITSMMVPLIAAMAELIGYEEQEIHGDIEGDTALTLTKKRERSPRNRLLCLSIHGEKCGVCDFTTKDAYGEELASILEVHHIEPLSEIGQPKAYNPRNDLIPLCPNCHRAAHKRTPPFTPQELKAMLKS